MKVYGNVWVELPDSEVRNILMRELQRLSEGLWEQDGKVMVYVDHPHNGWTEAVGDAADPKWELQLTASKLFTILSRAKK